MVHIDRPEIIVTFVTIADMDATVWARKTKSMNNLKPSNPFQLVNSCALLCQRHGIASRFGAGLIALEGLC